MEKAADLRSGTSLTISWTKLFAEFMAITAGVFLGLLADDYREYRAARETEQNYLHLLAADLNRDYEILTNLQRAVSTRSDGAQLINNTIGDAGTSADPIEQAITDIVFTLTYEPQRTAYLGLRDSAQVQLIESETLRSLLTFYFEVTQPDLLASIVEYNQYQQHVRRGVGQYVRLFSPDRFSTLNPEVSNVIKLIAPLSDIRADNELMNDIVEVGARGYQLADITIRAQSQNRELLSQLTKYME